MPTFCIDESSFRIDKTVWPTEKEAISKAAECARVLNRPIAVYKVMDPGSNSDSYPEAKSAVTKLYMVMPDGSINREPSVTETQTPFALGKYDRLMQALAEINKELLKRGADQKLIQFTDQQVEAFVVAAKKIKASKLRLQLANKFKSGDVFGNSLDQIKIQGNTNGLISYLSSASKSMKLASAEIFAKHLLVGKYSKVVAEPLPVMSPVNPGEPESPPLLPAADETEQLNNPSPMGDSQRTLLGYCMDLCNNDINSAVQLETSIASAIMSDPLKLKAIAAMRKYNCYSLPKNWVLKALAAYKSQSKQNKTRFANVNLVPPADVRKMADAALKMAKTNPPNATTLSHARSLASGQPITPAAFERMGLFLSRNKSSDSASIVWLAWGGGPGLRWVNRIKTQTAAVKLLKTVSGPKGVIRVEWDSDNKEFRVRPADSGKNDEDGKTYFTDDKEDAFKTADHMSKNLN